MVKLETVLKLAEKHGLGTVELRAMGVLPLYRIEWVNGKRVRLYREEKEQEMKELPRRKYGKLSICIMRKGDRMTGFDRTIEFTGKCPECKSPTQLVHTSKDGKAKFYKCNRGHPSGNGKAYPVYMVE